MVTVDEVLEARAELSQGKGRKGGEPGGGWVKFGRETRGGASALVSGGRGPAPAPTPSRGVFRASGRLLGKSQSTPPPPSSARPHSGRLQGQRVADEKHGPPE